MPDSKEPIVWLNDAWQSLSTASIPLFDLGLWGLAATEMMRSYAGKVVFSDRHVDRLLNSAKAMQFEADHQHLPEKTTLKSLINKAVRRNTHLIDPSEDLGLSVCITAGVNQHLAHQIDCSKSGTLSILPFRLPLSNYKRQLTTGQHLVTSTVQQITDASIPGHIKSRSRLHWRLAEIDVRRNYSDANPLLLDDDNYVTETSTSNLFIVKDSVISTPAVNILHGVTRQVVLELAASIRLDAHETNLTLNDVIAADEVFVSSSLSGICSVTQINGQTVGGQSTPITGQLIDAFHQHVGVDTIRQIQNSRD